MVRQVFALMYAWIAILSALRWLRVVNQQIVHGMGLHRRHRQNVFAQLAFL
jgi:hypothetical protein